MDGDDVGSFVEALSRRGLVVFRDEEARDVTIVDQLKGPFFPTPWLQLMKVRWGETDGFVLAAWLYDGRQSVKGVYIAEHPMTVVTPPTWRFEGSISEEHGYMEETEANCLRFLRREDDVDVYLNPDGKEVFVGRSDTG